MLSQRIVVIGAGISGLSAAWLLSRTHDVTLVESEPRLGGHSNTVDVPNAALLAAPAACDSRTRPTIPVDTGFIVFNPPSYPNLVALFDNLGVPTAETDMTFAVSRDAGSYEYSGSGIAGLFGQPSNVARPRHWRMLADLMRFFREAPNLLEGAADPTLSLGDWLAREGYGKGFVDDHILPMAAAIWSTPAARVLDFPALAFVRFFANHSLLQAYGRPAWRTVMGGSRVYVERMRADIRGRIVTAAPVTSVTRTSSAATVTLASGERLTVDAVVMATHADTTLDLLADADAHERSLLSSFTYAMNRAVLHDDRAFMPKRRRLWSSWNYLDAAGENSRHLSVTYWMNRLQPLPTSHDWFVTLNPSSLPPAERIVATFDYAHPIFDAGAITAQRDLWSLQGRRRTWYCGSYFGYGFHEDGLQSGLAAAEDIGGVRRPWTVEGESSRLHIARRTTAAGSDGMLREAAE